MGVLTFVQQMLQKVIRDRPDKPFEYLKSCVAQRALQESQLRSLIGCSCLEFRINRMNGIPAGAFLSVQVGDAKKDLPVTVDTVFRLPRPLQKESSNQEVTLRLLTWASGPPVVPNSQDGSYEVQFSSSVSPNMRLTLKVAETDEHGLAGDKHKTRLGTPTSGTRLDRPSSPSSRLTAALAAREYLDQHSNLMQSTQELLQLLIREVPSHPYPFMLEYLNQVDANPAPNFTITSKSCKIAVPKVEEVPEPVLPVRQEQSLAVTPMQWQMRPSVGTWLDRPSDLEPYIEETSPTLQLLTFGQVAQAEMDAARLKLQAGLCSAVSSGTYPSGALHKQVLPGGFGLSPLDNVRRKAAGKIGQAFKSGELRMAMPPTKRRFSSLGVPPSLPATVQPMDGEEMDKTEIESWEKRPSVGTWLQAVPVIPDETPWVVELDDEPEPLPSKDEWYERSSVATWISTPTPPILGPWVPQQEYHEKPSVMMMELPLMVPPHVMTSIGGEPNTDPWMVKPSVGAWLEPQLPVTGNDLAEPETGHSSFRASVGTWLQARLEVDWLRPHSNERMHHKPSVGTWLQPLSEWEPEVSDPCEQNGPGEMLPSNAAFETMPVPSSNSGVEPTLPAQKPSVGTWMQPLPYDLAMVTSELDPTIGTWIESVPGQWVMQPAPKPVPPAEPAPKARPPSRPFTPQTPPWSSKPTRPVTPQFLKFSKKPAFMSVADHEEHQDTIEQHNVQKKENQALKEELERLQKGLLPGSQN
eukprot:gnl/MRDRNA2_/MRDRNA2_34367_c0_seq1.p1 gnl/MRDRNA2_/MRDRNA2_34367_c0~~gnl/MRDRNA2_/MRDRNA2_34367_c0_seq1.p1  ORF type:complete len:810 (-),score=147.80 gnl/MRDRNA2_/MRDRNA2_34367_c0_seq1:57-2309(-)